MNSSLLKHYVHEDDANIISHLSCNGALTSGGLAIKTATSADMKTANTVTFKVANVFKSLSAVATIDLSALCPGTIEDDEQAIVAVFVNAAGTVTAELTDPISITDTTALAAQCLPDFDTDVVCIGCAVIKNETGADFVVGTTALDKSGMTVTYYNLAGAFPGMVLSNS